jgi:hypothetical protein
MDVDCPNTSTMASAAIKPLISSHPTTKHLSVELKYFLFLILNHNDIYQMVLAAMGWGLVTNAQHVLFRDHHVMSH